MANNTNLGAAKVAKNDEFYTQYADIQKEVNAYLEYNPDTFRDKTVLLPCDDPEWSNFTKFFALTLAKSTPMEKSLSLTGIPTGTATWISTICNTHTWMATETSVVPKFADSATRLTLSLRTHPFLCSASFWHGLSRQRSSSLSSAV